MHVLGDAGAEAQDSQGGARQYHLHQEGSLADLPICLLHVHLALVQTHHQPPVCWVKGASYQTRQTDSVAGRAPT